ncbi:MAG: hypothetical protein ACRED8_02910, partial [Caulobacteraceae bacterium]
MSYRTDTCPGCKSPDFTSRPVVMAPFIAEYVFERPPDVRDVGACATCGLTFYTTRYDEHEIEQLYTNYRGERYLATRLRSEPW